MNLGGRPCSELSPTQLAEVETLAAVLTVAQMTDYFGIGRTTFFSIVNRDADVSERYKRGRARAVGAIAQSLVTKARAGDTTAMIFFLKTQAGWRETAGLELSGPNGGPVEVDETAISLQRFLESVSRHQAAAVTREAQNMAVAAPAMMEPAMMEPAVAYDVGVR